MACGNETIHLFENKKSPQVPGFPPQLSVHCSMARAKSKNKIFLTPLILRDRREKNLLVHFFFLFGGKKKKRTKKEKAPLIHTHSGQFSQVLRMSIVSVLQRTLSPDLLPLGRSPGA